jgi:hypothetical protein
MTADIINLRRARKQKRREQQDQTAATNRAFFGQTKAEKIRVTAELARLRSVVDGSRLMSADAGSHSSPGGEA